MATVFGAYLDRIFQQVMKELLNTFDIRMPQVVLIWNKLLNVAISGSHLELSLDLDFVQGQKLGVYQSSEASRMRVFILEG